MTAPRGSVSSYDPATTTTGGLAGELARLENQAALSWPDELRLLADLGLGSAGPLLELGCGPGAVTRRLRAALPAQRLIAIDADESLLRHATHLGVPLAAGQAEALPLRSGSVGTALLRYVMQHLPAPAPVLAELRRVLQPGGLLAVIDVDGGLWGLAEPLFPDLASLHERLASRQREAGGQRLIGRRLTRLLRDAGFHDVVMRPFAVTSDERPIDDFAAHLGPERFAPLLGSGTLSLREFALAASCWQQFRADPNAWIMLLGFIVTGRAPAGPASAIDTRHESELFT
jgi:SAM-dependent methyltransferase